MNDAQVTFLAISVVYLIIKGGALVALYGAMVAKQKKALVDLTVMRSYMSNKQEKEQERWKVAYQQYENRKQKPELEYSEAL